MMAELERRGGWLPEGEAASFIERTFGREFVRREERGPISVNRSVVDAFFEVSAGTVRWNHAERAWSGSGGTGERFV